MLEVAQLDLEPGMHRIEIWLICQPCNNPWWQTLERLSGLTGVLKIRDPESRMLAPIDPERLRYKTSVIAHGAGQAAKIGWPARERAMA